MNNKGVTLVELIVSFAIVGVAIIYFFQTLTTVNKLYYTARKETNEFVEKSYALRIADAYVDAKIDDTKNSVCDNLESLEYPSEYSYECVAGYDSIGMIALEIRKNGSYVATLYKYIK